MMDTAFEDRQGSTWSLSKLSAKAVFFIIPIFNVVDYVSDITVLVRFLLCETTRRLGYISLTIILVHRLTSAIVLGDQYD